MVNFDPAFVAKLQSVERHLSDEHSGFSLFALLQRFGSSAYDLVVAAPWLDESSKAHLQMVVMALNAELTPIDLRQIASVVILRPDHPGVKYLNMFQVEHGSLYQGDNVFNNMKLRSGLVITSVRRD